MVSDQLITHNLLNYLNNKPCNKHIIVTTNRNLLPFILESFFEKIINDFNNGNPILPIFHDYYQKVRYIDPKINFSNSLFDTPYFIKFLQHEIEFKNIKSISRKFSKESLKFIVQNTFERLVKIDKIDDRNFYLYKKLLQITEIMKYCITDKIIQKYNKTMNKLNDNGGVIYILNIPKFDILKNFTLNTNNKFFQKYHDFYMKSHLTLPTKYFDCLTESQDSMSQLNDLILFVKNLSPNFISSFTQKITDKIKFTELYCEFLIERLLAGHSVNKEKFIFENFHSSDCFHKIGRIINEFYTSITVNKNFHNEHDFDKFNTTMFPDHIYNHTDFLISEYQNESSQLQKYITNYFQFYKKSFHNRRINLHLLRGSCEMVLEESDKKMIVICNPLQALYIETFNQKQDLNINKKLLKQLRESLEEVIVNDKIVVENKTVNIIDKFNFWKDVIKKVESQSVIEHEVVMKSNIISILKHNNLIKERLKHELEIKLKDYFPIDENLYNSVLENMKRLLYIKYDNDCISLNEV